MEIQKIVDYVNRGYVASEYLRDTEVYYLMDLVIDDINERLQSRFPTITDWNQFVTDWNNVVTKQAPASRKFTYLNFWEPKEPNPMLMRDNTKYDAFPDEYIRNVLALGVACKFYVRDEEGEQIALDYQNRYERALFNMTRDYHNMVPPWFQDNTGGFIDFSYNREFCGPWDLHPRGVVTRGKDTKVL